MAKPKGSPKTGGRKKGTPNRATAAARAAIGRYIQANVNRLQVWLDKVAEKNPDRAFVLLASVIEYHVPKLSRSERTGKDGVWLPCTVTLNVREPLRALSHVERC